MQTIRAAAHAAHSIPARAGWKANLLMTSRPAKWYFSVTFAGGDVSDVKYFAFGVTNVGKTGVGGDRLARKAERVQHTDSGQYFIPFLAFPKATVGSTLILNLLCLLQTSLGMQTVQIYE